MPTYEYVCESGHEIEARQSIRDDPLEICPRADCEAPARRRISTGGGLLTGTPGSGPSAAGAGGCGTTGFT